MPGGIVGYAREGGRMVKPEIIWCRGEIERMFEGKMIDVFEVVDVSEMDDGRWLVRGRC